MIGESQVGGPSVPFPFFSEFPLPDSLTYFHFPPVLRKSTIWVESLHEIRELHQTACDGWGLDFRGGFDWRGVGGQKIGKS